MRNGIGKTALLMLCLLPFSPAGTVAQESVPPVITPYDVTRDAGYERSVLLRRLQTEVVYVADLQGELPLDGVPLPPPEDTPRRDGNGEQTIGRAVVLVGLAVLLVLIFVNRQYLFRLLGRDGKATPAPHTVTSAAPAGAAPDLGLLARLASAADREAALVELLQAALAAAARANGLRLGRSETARDFLRRLPRDWPHLSNLRTIVMTEELVQFGGRPLAAEAFQTCIAEARPIMERAAAHRMGAAA